MEEYSQVETDFLLWINGIVCFFSLCVEIVYFYVTTNHPYLYSNSKNRMIRGLLIANTISTVGNIPPYFGYNDFMCVFSSFLRHFGNLSGVFFVGAIARSTFLQLFYSKNTMAEVYKQQTLLCLALAFLWSLIPLVGTLTGWYAGIQQDSFLCSMATSQLILDNCVVVFLVLIYVAVHYRKVAVTLLQQARDIGLEDMIDTKQMYHYPIIMILAWLPTWIYLIMKEAGSETLYGIFLLNVVGVHSQGAINGIYYLYQKRFNPVEPRDRENTIDVSAGDEVQFEGKAWTEEEARKKLEMALKF